MTLPEPFDPRRALTGVASVGLVGSALVVVNLTTGWGVLCPFKALTGWDCPLCGATRMGAALARGQIDVAFGWNPVVFVGAIVLAVCCVAWLVEALGGPAWRPLRRWGGLGQTRLYWLLGVVAVTFTLARNLL